MIDIMSTSGEVLVSIPVLKESVAREELMTEDYVQLFWNSDKGDVLPVGCYVMHDTEKYYLMKPYTPNKVSETEYRYQPKFESRVVRWKKTPVPIYTYESDGLTVKSREFDWNFTGTPDDAMFIIQRAIFHETGEEWEYTVNEGLPETISISSQASSIWSILSDIADQCKTEWWTEKRISQLHLGKCYHGPSVVLEVGKNVKVPSVIENGEDYYTRFYAFGSTRNITQENRVSNGSIVNKRLCLDPVKYPHGYKDIKGHFENGVFVSDLLPEEIFPTTLYFEDIYPSSKLTIGNVRRRLRYRFDEDGNKVLIGGTEESPVYETYAIWYFQVPSFNFTEDLIIEGQELSVHFKSGQLRGREFSLAYHKDAKVVTDSADVEDSFEVRAGDYEIIFDEQTEGFIIPSVDYIIPQNGDEVVLFNIEMPSEYVSSSQIELESELDKEIARRTTDNNSYEFNSNPVEFYNAGTFLEVGQKVTFINKGVTLETRALMVEKHLDCTYEQKIRVGNSVIVGTRQQLQDEVREVGQEIDALHSQSNNMANVQRSHERELLLTMGRFFSMQDTMKMLESAVKGYSEAITPITVQTMAMMVGDEGLQYRFTNSRTSLVSIPCPVSYDAARKQMVATKSSLIHLTLGITSITAKDVRKASDYMSWDMAEWNSAVLSDADKRYYVYAYVEENGTNGTFRLSEVARDMREDKGYLYLLVGILNAEYAERREFVTVYGFTEILPNQVITDRIESADGQTYFDLSRGEIGGRIVFKSNRGGEKSVADLEEEIQDQIDGVVENWNGEGAPTTTNAPVSNWKTDAEKIAHINDTYINIEEYIDDETTPTAGHAWRWCRCEDSTIEDKVAVTDKDGNRFNLHWHPIADSDAVRALKEAAEALEKVNNIPDTEYLRKVFKEGTTEIEGGVVMSETVAVRDSEDSNIEAFLNGSSKFSDADNGKMLLVAGIPDVASNGSTALADRVKEAKAIIFENGVTDLTDGFLNVQRGRVGSCYANDFSLGNSNSYGDVFAISMPLDDAQHDSGVYAKSGNVEVSLGCARNSSGVITSVSSFHRNAELTDLIKRITYETAHGLRITSDKKLPFVNLFSSASASDFAVMRTQQGMFEGLRPKVVSPTSNYYANEYDHTIIIEKSGITVYLPTSPKVGQRYEIFKQYSASVNIDPRGVQVYSSGSYGGNNGLGTNVTKLGTSGFARAVYIYTGTYWFRTVENYD